MGRYSNSNQREQIWNKDNGWCGICGGSVDPAEGWDADHIIPWEKGGLTTIENGQVTHPYCNRSKKDRYQKRTRGPVRLRGIGQGFY